MAETIAERIAARVDTMSAGERRAAQTLIANYPLLGLKTVAEFAQAAGVSSPTILRFVARLDILGYPEFQASLQEEVSQRLQSPLSRSSAPQQDGPVTHPLVEATIDNLRETFRHVSERQVAEIASLISERKARVYLLGGRFTDAIARYMGAHLSIIRPDVFHLSGQEGNWNDRLLDMGRRDVLVIFDIRRYQGSLLDFAAAADKRGVQIVLVTDQWLSPIARFARHVVAGRTMVPSPWDSSASLFVLAEALVAEATRSCGADAARRISEIEALRR